MLDARFVLVGGAIQVFGSTRYILAVVRGHAVPHRLTWFLWSVAPLVVFSAELSQGVGIRSLMTLLVGLSPLAILITSFVSHRGATWEFSRFDLVCGALSVVGLVLWQLTGDGNLAIALSLTADALAAAPTIRKAIVAPETESYSVFLSGAISAAITLLTIDEWTFANVAWPAYIFSVGTLLVILIRFPRRRSPSELASVFPVGKGEN